jgi:carboxymethylenebutenolidase
MAEVEKTTPKTIQLDVAACVAWLRGRGTDRIFTVGFCFGGRNSWLATAEDHGLAGAVGFYGSLGFRGDRPGPIARAAELTGPILALQAGDDQNITREQNDEFDAALTAAGVEHELVIYDGAPHSFFDRKQGEFADASEDAWNRVLAFIA